MDPYYTLNVTFYRKGGIISNWRLPSHRGVRLVGTTAGSCQPYPSLARLVCRQFFRWRRRYLKHQTDYSNLRMTLPWIVAPNPLLRAVNIAQPPFEDMEIEITLMKRNTEKLP